MTTMTKKFRRTIVTMMAMVLVMFASVQSVYATTNSNSKGDKTINVVYGLTTLNVTENGEIWTYQLTKSGVAKEAYFDADDVAWVLYDTSTKPLYWYYYDGQKDNVDLHKYTDHVVDLNVTNGLITGLEKDSGTQSLKPIEEIKKELGMQNNGTNNGNNGNNGTNNGNNDNNGTNNGNNGNNGTNNGNNGNNGTNNGNNGNNGTNNGNNGNNGTNNGNNGNNGTNNNTPKVTVSNGVVSLEAIENGNKRVYTLENSNIIDKGAFDPKTNTAWIRTIDNVLRFWNYDLQKGESGINLHVATDKCAALVTDSQGNAIGYYVTGSTTMTPIWGIEQIRVAIYVTPQKTTTTNKTVRNYRVVVKNKTTILQNNKGKNVEKFSLPRNGGTLKYHSVKITKVKYATFNKKGNVLFIRRNRQFGVINRKTLKKSIKKSNVVRFNYTSRGLGKKGVKRGGAKFSVSNY